ncbi:MAG: AbrB/MazE/SpoVT family DNA-binding domain-containing protein [Chitinophagales bacterium]
METSVMTSKGQIPVPVKLRRKMNMKPGSRIAFIEKGNELTIRALDKEYFDSLAGWLPETGDPLSELIKEKQAEKKR